MRNTFQFVDAVFAVEEVENSAHETVRTTADRTVKYDAFLCKFICSPRLSSTRFLGLTA
ncbi:MAG TPA: hypothetical protein VM821_06120 [Abditibacteriaceae bacterium]|nr:hypothetical protein [Abditibacteriaceae bacterium]